MTRTGRGCILVLVLALMTLLPAVPAAAQKKNPPPEQKPAAATPAPEKSSHQAEQEQVSGEAGRAEPAKESSRAEGDENAEFKESASVKALARLVGVSPHTMYQILLVINFLIIAGLIFWIAKGRVPEMFRARTREIQKNLEESRRASEEAGRRLAEIEERLAKLNDEIGALRAAAEGDARAEEERIRALAEADKRKIVESAEQEIEAAAGQARRGLKAFTAELAVALAEKKIKVDPNTDKALVRNFVGQIKDGK